MNPEDPTNDPCGDDEVIFVAEGLLCEQLGVSMDDAVVALADMAVERSIGLLELAREVVAEATDPGSLSEARRPAQDPGHDPGS